MKKTLFVAFMVSVMALAGRSALQAQPMDPGPECVGNLDYCPYCGNYIGPGYGMGPWMMGRGHGGYGMGPWMMGRGHGGYGMGPWMMGRGYGGYGMGPWMMGRGDSGYGMMGPGYGYEYWPQYDYGPQSQRFSKPLDKDRAKQEVESYLKSTRNPNLKIGEIEEKGNDYELNIETKDGSLVDKILVSKQTGWMRSAY
jgi:hypothetical protein